MLTSHLHCRKFPDVIHAGKPEPDNEIPQAQSAHNNFWGQWKDHELAWQTADSLQTFSICIRKRLTCSSGPCLIERFHDHSA